MTIICTCGCKVDDFDLIVNCSIKGWSRESTPCVNYVSYCPECYHQAMQDGRVLFDEAAEMNWLFTGDKE